MTDMPRREERLQQDTAAPGTGPVRAGETDRRQVPNRPVAVVANRPVGAYRHLVLDAPDVAALARPGQFVALSVGAPGGTESAHLLRRCFSIHRADSASWSGTIELVVSAVGPGTEWITALQPGETVGVVGPLGRPFPLPKEPVPSVLVGGGYGAAPLCWLADVLLERGCPVEMVLGAASEDKVFGVEQGNRAGATVTVTTDDGSAGVRGWVSDVLPEVMERSGAAVAYACGPMGMLRSVTQIATKAGAVAQVAVEEAMACGVGVCMTCVLAIRGNDGVTRMTRSCVEGPVFRGDRVRWDALEDGGCRVPSDALGAPKEGGH